MITDIHKVSGNGRPYAGSSCEVFDARFVLRIYVDILSERKKQCIDEHQKPGEENSKRTLCLESDQMSLASIRPIILTTATS